MFGKIDSAVNLAQLLIQSPSVKGNTLHAANILQSYFRQHDLEPTVDNYKEGEANVYLKLGPVGTPMFIISGHLDVVPSGNESKWKNPPFSGSMVGGELWGRGAVDMKAGLAVLAELMVEFSQETLKQQVMFIATAEEETGLLGSKHLINSGLLDEENINGILIAEPTGLQPLVVEKGVIWVKITADGKQSHGSRPDLGVNAVNEIIKILDKMPDSFPIVTNDLVGTTTVNITSINGGGALNVGVESATITLDIRTPPEVDNEVIIQGIQDLLVMSAHEDLQFSLDVLYSEPPIMSPSRDLAEKLAKQTWELTGTEPDIGGAHYTTDGTVFMSSLDELVPYVIFGPGSPELLHQTDERISVNEIFQSKTIISNVMKQILL